MERRARSASSCRRSRGSATGSSTRGKADFYRSLETARRDWALDIGISVIAIDQFTNLAPSWLTRPTQPPVT